MKIIFLIFFLVRSFSVLSQPIEPGIGKLAHEFDSLAQKSSNNIVYIQTSKEVYEAGEDLWFKAYAMDAHNFSPSFKSKTLYLQVFNERTKGSVWQEKYEIQNGFADGHVFLQDSLPEGDYMLAAFTGQSCLNDKTEFNSLKRIKVRKDMTPRPLLDAAFDRHYYKSGDTIRIKFTALSEKKDPLKAQIASELRQGSKLLGQYQTLTNDLGKAEAVFILQVPGEGLRIDVTERYADLFDARIKSMSFPVPCKKGPLIQFDTFPEGGNIVAGLPCNLAFKAVTIDGNPIDIDGTLFEDDKALCHIKSIHAGMGSQLFTPLAEKKYTIHLSEKLDSTFSLPAAAHEGLTMHLADRDKEYLVFKLSKSPGQKKETVYLRGQLRGVVYCVASGILNDELTIKIPVKEFPLQGIAEFTLFRENMEPVAERLVYMNPDKRLYLETAMSGNIYQTREKVSLKITVKDENGQPVVANLGVTGYDKLYHEPCDPKNILTHCYLTSQLKGKIYDPGYYFESKNKDREEALNLLLLTQGWRRYVWCEKDLKESNDAKPTVVFDGTEGEVHATRRPKKVSSNQFVKAFNPGKSENANLMLADLTGKFFITPEQLKTWQGAYIYLKPMATDDFAPRITLYDPFQSFNEILKKEIIYPVPGQKDLNLEDSPDNQNVEGHNTVKLNEIIIQGRSTKTFRDKYMGHLDSIAKLDLCTDYECSEGCSELNCQFHTIDKSHKPVEGKEYCKRIGGGFSNPYLSKR